MFDPWRKKRAMGLCTHGPLRQRKAMPGCKLLKKKKLKKIENINIMPTLKSKADLLSSERFDFCGPNTWGLTALYGIYIDITGFCPYNIADFLTFARRQYYVRHTSGLSR